MSVVTFLNIHMSTYTISMAETLKYEVLQSLLISHFSLTFLIIYAQWLNLYTIYAS